jgi:hypothetical protein
MIAREPAATRTALPISGIYSDDRLNCPQRRVVSIGRPVGRSQWKCRDDQRTCRCASVGGAPARHWRAMPGPIVGRYDDLRSRQTNPAARESRRTRRSEPTLWDRRTRGANGPAVGWTQTNPATRVRTNPAQQHPSEPSVGERKPSEPGQSKRTQRCGSPNEPSRAGIQTSPAEWNPNEPSGVGVRASCAP